jgi:hypothetical protein
LEPQEQVLELVLALELEQQLALEPLLALELELQRQLLLAPQMCSSSAV